MAGNKSEVDPKDAFQIYFEMGAERSINGTFTTLQSRGLRIGRKTLMKWKDEFDWDKRVPEVEAARQLEAEAAKIKHQAAELLEQSGVARPAEELKPIRSIAVTDFNQSETTEAASERINATVAAMAQFCMDHIGRVDQYLEPAQLIPFINATRDLAKAAGDLHRAINPPAPKGKAAQDEAPGAQLALPGAFIPTDIERRKAALLDPPRLRGKI